MVRRGDQITGRSQQGTAWTRRSFLQATLLSASAGLAPRAMASPVVGDQSSPGALSLYNIHTGEALDLTFRSASGEYDRAALSALNRLLRCHYTGEVATIDLRVVEFLSAVDKHLGGVHEIHVVSGFRSRAYNDWLARHGHGVSPESLHLVGRAIDVRFPRVRSAAVRRAALALRRGGVGYYPGPNFVHLDSGRVRAW
jgi:uncharacterized protein YcbK (DUF882 family)